MEPEGLSRRANSAYGTKEAGRIERKPVLGDLYGGNRSFSMIIGLVGEALLEVVV